jgi:hypothetical protein
VTEAPGNAGLSILLQGLIANAGMAFPASAPTRTKAGARAICASDTPLVTLDEKDKGDENVSHSVHSLYRNVHVEWSCYVDA